MHRATPEAMSLRTHTSGGARAVVDKVNDKSLMQEMGGNFMANEARDKIESPQNYGFTSVVAEATKRQDGQITDSAEGFITFCGGNRSFPVCGVMDDRRHRLKGLQKGDTAMYRQRDDQQQFHMTTDGGYWSAPNNKTVRMQLVPQKQQQQGAQQQASGGQTGQQQQQQQRGQDPVYKDGQNSYRYVDVTQDATRVSGNESHLMLSDGDSYVHCVSQKAYLGGHASKHSFAKVMTESGAAVNVYARVGAIGELVAEDKNIIRAAARRVGILPAVMLILGVSLGVNYTLLTAGAASIVSACMIMAGWHD